MFWFEISLSEPALMTYNIVFQVWIYRNLVKALPWFSTVRRKLSDPAYAGFFLKFDRTKSNSSYHVPQCDTTFVPPKCTHLYHDLEQTPLSFKNASKDTGGHCNKPCDCGSNPCGEYLWDHRNGSMLRDFLINTYIGGDTGLGSPYVDGFLFDDHWDVTGPSEEETHCLDDIGLTKSDVIHIKYEWNKTVEAAHKKLIDMKGWSWGLSNSAYPGNYGNGDPRPNCAEFLRSACTEDSEVLNNVSIFQFSRQPHNPWPLPLPLPFPTQDVVMFLLSRGQYAYIGYGWQGCQCLPSDKYDHCLPHNVSYEFPELLERDYGEPMELCKETSLGSKVFRREWTKSTIEMDCNSWDGTIRMK